MGEKGRLSPNLRDEIENFDSYVGDDGQIHYRFSLKNPENAHIVAPLIFKELAEHMNEWARDWHIMLYSAGVLGITVLAVLITWWLQ